MARIGASDHNSGPFINEWILNTSIDPEKEKQRESGRSAFDHFVQCGKCLIEWQIKKWQNTLGIWNPHPFLH